MPPSHMGWPRQLFIVKNPLLKGDIELEALLNRRALKGNVSCNLSHADLYGLHMMDTPFAGSLKARLDFASDFKYTHRLTGFIGNLVIDDKNKIYHAGDITLDVATRRDFTHAVVNCGDFQLHLEGHGYYDRLLSESQHFMKRVTTSVEKPQD